MSETPSAEWTGGIGVTIASATCLFFVALPYVTGEQEFAGDWYAAGIVGVLLVVLVVSIW